MFVLVLSKTLLESGCDQNCQLSLILSLTMADLLSQEEMNDMGLEPEQVNVLKKCFDGFADEDGAIPADNVGNILSMMGLKVKPSALKDIIEEIDEDGKWLELISKYRRIKQLIQCKHHKAPSFHSL